MASYSATSALPSSQRALSENPLTSAPPAASATACSAPPARAPASLRSLATTGLSDSAGCAGSWLEGDCVLQPTPVTSSAASVAA